MPGTLKRKRPSKRALERKIRELKAQLADALRDAEERRELYEWKYRDWLGLFEQQRKQYDEFLSHRRWLEMLKGSPDESTRAIAYHLLHDYIGTDQRLKEIQSETARAIVSQLESAPTDTLRDEIADIRFRYIQ